MANSTLVGLFDDRDAAQGAVQDLVSAGISRDKISIIANDSTGTAQTTDTEGNLSGAGASAGISSGAVVGGVAGLLIGLGFTVLPIAGFLLAGPVAGLIAGAATGAVTGGVIGGLIGLGIPKEHAELYAEGVRRGGTLVTVQDDASNEDRIRDILDRDGAVDIEERGANWRSSGFTGYDADAQPYGETEIAAERSRYATSLNSGLSDTTTTPATSTADASYVAPITTATNYAAPVTNANDKIEIVEEQLQVGKREVERGGLRVRSFVTEKPVSEQVTLREEHVDIQRTPVDRPVGTDSNLFQESSLELRETAEVPVVAKEARVVEEVSLNKTASERTETVSDTVRRTDVEIEQLGEHGPAYAYGQQIASHPSYADDFDTNDSYRTEWESKNPGTWDKFKSTVKNAIDDVRGKSTNDKANLY